jgi:hypothetical protein
MAGFDQTNSILDTVKSFLGITAEETAFDTDIVVHTNAALVVLNQLGAGPEAGLVVLDATPTWVDFTTDTRIQALAVIYICLKVRLGFDPSASATITKTIQEQLTELEHRLLAITDLQFAPPVIEGDETYE